MSMFNKNALLSGVVVATVLGITFVSCSKDDNPTPPTPRSQSFELKGGGADRGNKVGDITITENTDSSVNVIVNLIKNTKDADHNVYFIFGTPVTPKKDTLYNGVFKGTGNAMKIELFKNVKKVSVTKETGVKKDTTFKYNDAIAFTSHIKILKGADTTAIGIFGKAN